MLRRLAPVLVVMVAVLAACQSTPALSDPEEIITQGLEATADLKSLHVSMALDGTFSDPDSGASFALDNTSLEADIDLDDELVSATFAIPALLGLAGDIRVIGTDMYIKTSMTGELWSHQVGGPDASASPAPDIDSMIAEVQAFLDKEGVTSAKLDDVDCGDGTCYHVQVTIPSELLAEEEAAASMDPSEIFGDAVVLDLLFDREKLWLTEVSTSVESESVGTFSATFTFSSFDESVTVTAPPEAETTEGEFTMFGM